MSTTFKAECHKTVSALRRRPVQCVYRTDDYELFAEHMLAEHQVKPYPMNRNDSAWSPQRTPKWVADAGKPWKFRMPRNPKPFVPKRFGVGDTVVWLTSGEVPTVMVGQVWSDHPHPNTRWVARDGHAWAVRQDQQAAVWLDHMYETHRSTCRRRLAPWESVTTRLRTAREIRLQIRDVERQLDELGGSSTLKS